MPRSARVLSQRRIYHVMLRGINKQQIFLDAEDNLYFLKLLKRYKAQCKYQLPAYCLMGNHVHLLIQTGDISPGDIFRHIGSAFVYWYNIKYARSGHLFQDRFKSEAVETDAYLLTVFRYILNNPVKAGICSRAEEYLYSSAKEYLSGGEGITDQELIKSILNENKMAEFIHQPNDDMCLEYEENYRKRYTDEQAKELILKEFGTLMPTPGRAKERASLNASICRLTKLGISIRQLSRLTGISRKIIENAIK